ncbi:MAG: hypothetical protein LBM77_07235 [Spirochaetaceae bacterium]|jgi:hypothetical protein|nr:hypothetical protein [Spirochaetaceae bacterium]
MKKNFFLKIFLLLAILVMMLFVSCFETRTTFVFNKDLSGEVHLVYRISRQLNGVSGKYYTEENYKKNVEKIPGLTFKSYSEKETEQDYIYSITIDFDKPEAIVQFFNTSYDGDKSEHTLFEYNGDAAHPVFIAHLGPANRREHADRELPDTIKKSLENYIFQWSFKTPADAQLTLIDAEGKDFALPADWSLKSGKESSFTAPMASLMKVMSDTAYQGVKLRLAF